MSRPESGSGNPSFLVGSGKADTGPRSGTFAGDVLGPGVKGGGQYEVTHEEAHEVQSQHGGDAPKGQALQDSAADAGAVAVVLRVAAVEGRSAQGGQQERQHGCYCRMVLLGRGQVSRLGPAPPRPGLARWGQRGLTNSLSGWKTAREK